MNHNVYRIKATIVKVVSNTARYLFLVALGYVLLYPFLFMISKSIQAPGDAYNPMVQWIPRNFSLSGFKVAMDVLDVPTAMLASLFYEIIAALLEIVSCAVAAYGLARFKFKGRGLLMGAVILNIFVPVNMIIIPIFVNFSHLDFLGILGFISKLIGTEIRPNLIDTPFVFWLPSIFGVGLKGGLFVYIYTRFFMGLPKELEEAAWVDGSGPLKTFMKIIVPSSGPAFVSVSLLALVWHWNDYFLPQMYLSQNYPLSVRLANIWDNMNNQTFVQFNAVTVVISGCLIFIIPPLIFYLVIQKKFITSIATSGIVG